MKRSFVFICKPWQLFKLFIAIVCLITVFNVVMDSIRPAKMQPMPHSEPLEIARGEYLSWEEAELIFRRYTNARVVDVDTGLSFKVQRRGGTNHADVQPLTERDTAIMRMIYEDQWSWRRKAIVLEVGDRRIAASMNGMPHGSGAIRGNNFKGHFCIHFRDSRVHKSGKENLAHQMMIWKSAGRFKQMLTTMVPEEVIEVFFTSVDQRDIDLAIKAIKPSDQDLEFLKMLDSKIDRIKTQRIRSNGGDTGNYLVYLTIRYQGDSKDVEKKIELKMVDNGEQGWKLQGSGLEELLNRKTSLEVILEGSFEDDDYCD